MISHRTELEWGGGLVNARKSLIVAPYSMKPTDLRTMKTMKMARTTRAMMTTIAATGAMTSGPGPVWVIAPNSRHKFIIKISLNQ